MEEEEEEEEKRRSPAIIHPSTHPHTFHLPTLFPSQIYNQARNKTHVQAFPFLFHPLRAPISSMVRIRAQCD